MGAGLPPYTLPIPPTQATLATPPSLQQLSLRQLLTHRVPVYQATINHLLPTHIQAATAPPLHHNPPSSILNHLPHSNSIPTHPPHPHHTDNHPPLNHLTRQHPPLTATRRADTQGLRHSRGNGLDLRPVGLGPHHRVPDLRPGGSDPHPLVLTSRTITIEDEISIIC